MLKPSDIIINEIISLSDSENNDNFNFCLIN